MSRLRSPINHNAQPDSPDRNIHVVSIHVSGSAPGYQTLSASSEGYGYSQNFENYDFYDPSGYSYTQYNEPQYSSDRRDFYGYQHYEQQQCGGFDFAVIYLVA